MLILRLQLVFRVSTLHTFTCFDVKKEYNLSCIVCVTTLHFSASFFKPALPIQTNLSASSALYWPWLRKQFQNNFRKPTALYMKSRLVNLGRHVETCTELHKHYQSDIFMISPL